MADVNTVNWKLLQKEERWLMKKKFPQYRRPKQIGIMWKRPPKRSHLSKYLSQPKVRQNFKVLKPKRTFKVKRRLKKNKLIVTDSSKKISSVLKSKFNRS